MHAELRLGLGIQVGRKRVKRLMRTAGISGLVLKRRGRTTIRVPGVRVADDLVERNFKPAGPGQLWVADIAYLRFWEGWLYLAAVQDAFSRRIVGWSITDHMRSELVVDALQMAIARRRPETGLIHHSDQGSQFVSLAFGEEFETFMRTKDRAERARWLVQSRRLAAVLNDEAFDRRAAQQHAEQVQSEQAAYRETAKAILDDLGGLAVKGKRPTSTRPARLAQAVALGGDAGAALAPGLAATTGAVAGGLYMAGRGRKNLVKVASENEGKGRAQRARRSKLVQNLVTLCAFVVAVTPEGGE